MRREGSRLNIAKLPELLKAQSTIAAATDRLVAREGHMRFRVSAGLFRLWVVLSVLWLVGAGAYIVASYQNAPLPDLMSPAVKFDDLIPAYQSCWVNDGKRVDPNDFINVGVLGRIAECERTVDRWAILKTGTVIALGIPIAVFIIGWGLIWAVRGFLPAR